MRQAFNLLGMAFLALPLILYGNSVFQRPARVNQTRPLFQGITYHREARSIPRPLMLHIVSIDLTAPGIRPFVTPGNPRTDNTETHARTTSEFLSAFKLQLAINASFFYPFREKAPWDYYPQSGERANAIGQAISDGVIYSPAESSWSVLCFSANHQAQILDSSQCPTGTTQGIAGSSILIRDGKPQPQSQTAPDSDNRYSRTVVAIDATGQKLWIVVVDDKQLLYSEGATLAEITDILLQLGAETALNLDGGGSSTLVAAVDSRPQVLNSPVHTKIPGRERPVANHLGFYASPLIPPMPR